MCALLYPAVQPQFYIVVTPGAVPGE
jgi:hypothetical protein